jgi:DNA helicase-2/ATP-dependent DNA helicase PcrA
VINQDGIEILDADAPLPAVMSPLSAFLSHASLEAGDNQATVGQDAVQMMTVHSAKGLEFNNVFITGWKKGCSRTRAARANTTAWKKNAA